MVLSASKCTEVLPFPNGAFLHERQLLPDTATVALAHPLQRMPNVSPLVSARAGWPGQHGPLSPPSKFRDKDERLTNTFHGSQLRIKSSPSFQETSSFICKTLSFRKKRRWGEKQSRVLLLPNHSKYTVQQLSVFEKCKKRGTKKSSSCFSVTVPFNSGLKYPMLESAPVCFLCLEILSSCWSFNWKKIYSFSTAPCFKKLGDLFLMSPGFGKRAWNGARLWLVCQECAACLQ